MCVCVLYAHCIVCACTGILLAQVYSQTTPDIYRHFLLLSDQPMLCSDILSVHVSAHVRVCVVFLFGPNHFCSYKVLTRHSVCMGPGGGPGTCAQDPAPGTCAICYNNYVTTSDQAELSI